MENRPIEVAVAEPSEDVLALKKKIKDLEHNTEQKLTERELVAALTVFLGNGEL